MLLPDLLQAMCCTCTQLFRNLILHKIQSFLRTLLFCISWIAMHQFDVFSLACFKTAVLAAHRQFLSFSSACVGIMKYKSYNPRGLLKLLLRLSACNSKMDNAAVCVWERWRDRWKKTEDEWNLLQGVLIWSDSDLNQKSHFLICPGIGRICVPVCACVCVCVCACTLLLWRPSEGMSRSVSVCLCSPILSLALCDNRFYHTVHFCVFVCACACACVCWSVYAVQSLSSTVIFKVFVQRWRSDAIW